MSKKNKLISKKNQPFTNSNLAKRVVDGHGSIEKFRRMATVIQDSNDAITFQDLEGNILAWNRGADSFASFTEHQKTFLEIDVLLKF